MTEQEIKLELLKLAELALSRNNVIWTGNASIKGVAQAWFDWLYPQDKAKCESNLKEFPSAPVPKPIKEDGYDLARKHLDKIIDENKFKPIPGWHRESYQEGYSAGIKAQVAPRSPTLVS